MGTFAEAHQARTNVERRTGHETRAEDGVHKKSTANNPQPSIPARFKPRFWKDADSRIHVVRVIRKRYELLKEHCGGHQNVQRELLYPRPVIILIILEPKEDVLHSAGDI